MFFKSKVKSSFQVLEEVESLIERVTNDVKKGYEEYDLYKHSDIAIGSVINAVLNGFRFVDFLNE